MGNWEIEIKIIAPNGKIIKESFIADKLTLIIGQLKKWLDNLGPY